MSNLVRIDPPIFVHTPLGLAEAHWFEVSEGYEQPNYFHTFQCETKEQWSWPNNWIRIDYSVSGMRSDIRSKIHVDKDMLQTLKPHILSHKYSPFYEEFNAS